MRFQAGLLALLAMAAASALASGVRAQSAPSVTVTATDPDLFGRLGDYEHLFVRLSYRTAQPIVLRIEGVAGGSAVPGMSDGEYHANPGEGEAMLWIAYKPGVTIDGLRVSVRDESRRVLSSVDMPAHLQWVEGSVRDMKQRPEWALRMYAEEQRPRPSPPPTLLESVAGTAFILGIPLLYFILQAWLAFAWTGGWRTGALAPLILTGPAILWSLYALADQSNLWPITVILLAPFALAYLLILCLARAVAKPSAS